MKAVSKLKLKLINVTGCILWNDTTEFDSFMSFLKEKKFTPRGFTAHDELKIAMESFLALDEFQKNQ